MWRSKHIRKNIKWQTGSQTHTKFTRCKGMQTWCEGWVSLTCGTINKPLRRWMLRGLALKTKSSMVIPLKLTSGKRLSQYLKDLSQLKAHPYKNKRVRWNHNSQPDFRVSLTEDKTQPLLFLMENLPLLSEVKLWLPPLMKTIRLRNQIMQFSKMFSQSLKLKILTNCQICLKKITPKSIYKINWKTWTTIRYLLLNLLWLTSQKSLMQTPKTQKKKLRLSRTWSLTLKQIWVRFLKLAEAV